MTTSTYRIHWDGDDRHDGGQVSTEADTATGAITLTVPGSPPITLDVVTARAVSMLLSHMVFGVLHPDGPYLAIDTATEHGWTSLREAVR